MNIWTPTLRILTTPTGIARAESHRLDEASRRLQKCAGFLIQRCRHATHLRLTEYHECGPVLSADSKNTPRIGNTRLEQEINPTRFITRRGRFGSNRIKRTPSCKVIDVRDPAASLSGATFRLIQAVMWSLKGASRSLATSDSSLRTISTRVEGSK